MSNNLETTAHAGAHAVRPDMAGQPDAAKLAADLRAAMRGEVRFDTGSRALYATDASNYRQVPIGVVLPADTEDLVRAVEVCRRHEAPVLPRGGGTSLAGQCCNVAVVIDCSKYLNRVIETDPERRLARVQPGVVLDELRDAAERHGLTFGPDPATHDHCTLGGMIGNNSCGVHSVMAGKTADNVEALEVLTYDGVRLRVGRTGEDELAGIVAGGGRRGEIYRGLRDLRDRYADLIRARFPDIPRCVSGYNLPALLPENGFDVARALVGSEGTCVTVLEATLRLVPSPRARSLVVLGYPDVAIAADHVPAILDHHPIGLEGFDDRMVEDMTRQGIHPDDVTLLPDGGGWLLVEFGADDKKDADDRARELMEELGRTSRAPSMKRFDDPAQEKTIWRVREAALGATAHVPGEAPAWPGWEDSAVPPARMGDYLRDLRALLDRYGYACSFYGHFGQGCLHTRIDFDLTSRAGIDRFRAFLDDAAGVVLGYGGSVSGEHGDGQARAALLARMFGEELVSAFREFKALWDPAGKMNPGKVVDAARPDEDLRLGAGYDPPAVKTHFSFPDDGGSFARATLRCVGIGACRRHEGGTMCPSYMATREEEHSTRGRARLLFEMVQGDPLIDGWRSEAVRDALDLCLACKGCKGDCPVHVDLATYKAEFLSHYYARRLRPVTAYSMGLISWWARLAAHAPGLANTLTQTPLLRTVAKRLAGIAPERRIPAFAPETFATWFVRREHRIVGGPRVLLWSDTFNNHFHPETAAAAVEVLEAAGFAVELPRRSLCCGRPLYDWGMLGLAERQLRQILAALRDEIRAGVPVVVLEPSCASVFRDELCNLLPHDEDAKRLARQTYLLSEFLERCAPDFRPPKICRKALVHGHCHHKAVMGMAAEEAVLRKLGVEFETLDAGCCGMAGAFGFERGDHYDVSIKAGERVLLPAVRRAPAETLIVADGFSCREQVAQTTDRHALHLAEVLQLALHGDGGTPHASSEGEATTTPDGRNGQGARRWRALAGVAVGAAVAGAVAARRWEETERR
jgi:FAD/FMN-containing dehydrogenase/Fe-S oxidoreductase